MSNAHKWLQIEEVGPRISASWIFLFPHSEDARFLERMQGNCTKNGPHHQKRHRLRVD
jgi:hypothetical protein